jgi:hypothetical protein
MNSMCSVCIDVCDASLALLREHCLIFSRPTPLCLVSTLHFISSHLISPISQSLQRMDSFLELVASSMEYAESTSTQLQPSSGLLNRKLLGSIYDLSRTIRDETAASGR